MPVINLFADFHFIAMDKSMENEGFPSKAYSIMASGKPLAVVSSEQTPIINFLKETHTALLVINHSVPSFKEAFLKLADDKELELEMGENGRKIIKENFTKTHVINHYFHLIENAKK